MVFSDDNATGRGRKKGLWRQVGCTVLVGFDRLSCEELLVHIPYSQMIAHTDICFLKPQSVPDCFERSLVDEEPSRLPLSSTVLGAGSPRPTSSQKSVGYLVFSRSTNRRFKKTFVPVYGRLY